MGGQGEVKVIFFWGGVLGYPAANIPQDATSGAAERATATFERIAKAKKGGVGLVVISQPAVAGEPLQTRVRGPVLHGHAPGSRVEVQLRGSSQRLRMAEDWQRARSI